MPALSEVTDLMLVEQGLTSLGELAREGTVLGGPDRQWCWGDDHDYSIRMTEDDEDAGPIDYGEQFVVCSHCHHVKLAPYLMVNGIEVSRRPEGEPAEPMVKAWAARRQLRLEAHG